MDEAKDAGRLSEKTRGLLAIYLPSLLVSFGTGMTAPAIPLMAASFGISTALAAQVVTAQILGRMIFVLPSGALVDRIGSKRSMILGAGLLTLAAIAAGFAPTFPLFLAAIFFKGAGANLWQIAREVAVIELVRPEQRGRAISVFFGISQLGTPLGPVFGGIVTDVWGFRALFLAYAALGLLVMAVSLTLREMKQEKRKPASIAKFASLSGLDPVFRTTFLVLIFATFCMFLRGTVLNSMLPLYAGVELGYSATRVGSLFGIAGLVNTLMIFPSGFLSDRFGRKAATVPAAALTGISFVAFAAADSMPMLAAAAALQGLGTGFALGSLTTSTFDLAPKGEAARFQSLRRFAAELGTLTGPALAGVVASLYTPGGVFLFFAPIFLVSALLLAVVARETHPLRRPPALEAIEAQPPAPAS